MASETDIGISVKCCIGIFDNEDTLRGLNMDDYQYPMSYILMVCDASTAHIILHAQLTILLLTPVKNRGHADVEL